MSQFDVYRFSDGTILVDLQSDFVESGTRVMAPLVREDGGEIPFGRLEPVVALEGERYFLQTSELVAVVARRLPAMPDGDLREDQDRIKAALDFLFLGF